MVESEPVASDETKLDFIHFFESKPYLTKKVKQFQTGCIKNNLGECASYTIDNEILGSVSGSSLKFFDKKLPHYYKGIEMRFFPKQELFLADEIKICNKKVS